MKIYAEQVNGITIARLQTQSLDASNAKEFKAQVSSLIIPGANLVFDLSNLTFVDSSGLGALLSSLRELKATGGALKLCSMVKPVRALFELVRMHRVFEIFNNQEEAVRACNYHRGTALPAID